MQARCVNDSRMLKIFQHFLFGTRVEKEELLTQIPNAKMEVTMSQFRWNQFPAMTNLFDDFFTKDLLNWGLDNNSSTNTTIPAVNIKETADSFEVEMAAPGMQKENFSVELDGNNLTIRSDWQNQEREDERYTRREFSYQSFQRTFTLPKNVVDVDQINAKYENGLLQLRIPKREEAKQKPPRMIQIQ